MEVLFIMDVLSVTDLTKRYPAFTLSGVGFTVRPGEIMGLIGRNGAGKSTTLKCLTGFVHPDAGSVSFFGMPLEGHELEIRRRMAFMAGGVDFYTRKKLRAITAVTRSFYPTWDEAAYQRYMKQFGLDEQKTPATLSAGMRVKYSLTLALSHHAELLILDEPTSGLDPISRDDLTDVFLGLQREGVSILFSTHITSDLEKCADRITYIHEGRVMTSEPLADFAGRYRLVAMESDAPEAWQPHLVGQKAAKHGFTALVDAQTAQRLRIPAREATLDEVMVHLEKENDKP